VSCGRAQEFLEKNALTVKSEEDARKDRKTRAEIFALARGVDKIVAAKGKRVAIFDMKRNPPDDETLLAHLLGPSGNLRAPAIRHGKTLFIGFNEDAYRDLVK
jgi:arsenate reductase-like glutaredoxin family protein